MDIMCSDLVSCSIIIIAVNGASFSDSDYGPYALDGKNKVPHPAVPEPMRSDFGWVDGSFGPLVAVEGVDYGEGKNYRWATGNWQVSRDIHFDEDGKRIDPTADEQNGQWAIQRLHHCRDPTDQPFLMAVGFTPAHTINSRSEIL